MPPLLPDDVILVPPPEGERLDFRSVFRWPEGISRPVELEIGCGKGRFLVEAATKWPERDFVALELVRSLVRKVRDKALRHGLQNVRVLPVEAKEALSRHVQPGSLSRIHVYFPDPWPKRRHAKNRLITPPFADLVAAALVPGGELLLATDHDPYFREAVARLVVHPAFVRTIPDAFREIPRGGFDAIFDAAGVPAFRGTWERRFETGPHPG